MGNYGNGLYRQLMEQIEKSERLEKENHELRQEVSGLKKLLEKILSSVEDQVERAVWRVTVSLVEELGQKDEQIKKLSDEVIRLKSQINKDSSNSGKPPSSNGYKKIPNNREPSERKSGGQKGHKGYTLTIPSNLEEVVKDGKARHIIIDQVPKDEPYVSDWIVDIETQVVYTQVRRQPGAPETRRYGSGLQALCVWLMYKGMVSMEKVGEFIEDLTGGLVKPSEGAIQEFAQTVASNIELSGYREDLLNAVVIHVDDTQVKTTQRPNREGKLETSQATSYGAHIRCYSSSTTTILTGHTHKDEEGIKRDNILGLYCGIVVQDGEAKFYNYGLENAACGVHLCRELKGMAELSMIPWASRLRSFMLEMNNHKNDDLAAGKTKCEPLLLLHYEQWYDELIELGEQELSIRKEGTLGYDDLRKMLNRLKKRKDNYMLFIRNYAAPFSNNQAERDLRHCKTKQKVSGCFRSWMGLEIYCKIRSLLDTTKKRSLSVFVALSSHIPAFALG